MMNETVRVALNAQINKELLSAYLYLGMSLSMNEANFKGYSHWLQKQAAEEMEHAQEFISYLQKRDAKVELESIPFTPCKTQDPLEVAEAVLAHERSITESINQLTELVQKEKDHATEIFLHSFITEQIEEEDNAQDIISMFQFAGESKAARYQVDLNLGNR